MTATDADTHAPTATDAMPASFWRERMAPYAQANVRRGLVDLATSVVPYLVLTAAMYLLLPVSYWEVMKRRAARAAASGPSNAAENSAAKAGA